MVEVAAAQVVAVELQELGAAQEVGLLESSW